MMLIDESEVTEAIFPVDALKRHLRLGSGFAEDDLQDAVLLSFVRAASVAIEGRTGKALFTRGFRLVTHRLRDRGRVALPIAPVVSVEALTLEDADGVRQVVEPSRYRLEADPHAPAVVARSGSLPDIPEGGKAEIAFSAGYGTTFETLPGDLAQAVLLLAAHYYEYRHETALGEGCMPFGVTSLIARYRPLRMGFGA